MRQLLISLSIIALLSACSQPVEPNLSPSSGHGEAAADAAPAGEHAEKKPKPDEKPKPDSVISSVLSLPVVKKWGEFMEAKGDGSKIIAWGEYVKEVKGAPCWSIAVAEESGKGATNIWKRFCMQQSGLEMWVESVTAAAPGEEIGYITYDNWMKNCEPAYNSPGKC